MIYTLKESLKRIYLSEYKKKTMQLLKEFLTDANESRSVAEAFSIYKKIYGKATTKRIIELLDGIETNYVTVTTKDAKLFKNACVPTPLELFTNYR